MVTTNALRQIHWKLWVGEQVFTPPFAIFVALFNTMNNGLNNLVSIYPLTSNAPALSTWAAILDSKSRVLGMILFAVGSVLETGAERGRSAWKKEERNKGKLYVGGAFAWARHVNFGGYLLWRSGFALFAGGWAWGTLIAAAFMLYFTKAGIPPLAEYMEERYGVAWTEYKRQVPWLLIPWVY